ncbi:MAG: DUF3419 family protein [Pyrinomonadaceae bacterium]
MHGNRINYFAKGGLYEHSRNGYFLRFFHEFSRLLGWQPGEVLKAETLAEQERLYEKNIAPFFDSMLVKSVGKMPVTMFGLGIPPQQYDELKKDLAENKNIIDVYRERAKRMACAYPIKENYFAWQAFARRYDTETRQAVPEYLKAENHAMLKSNAHKIKTNVGSVTEEIRQNPKGTFNRFVFLDAQDWMNADAMTRALAGNRRQSRTRIKDNFPHGGRKFSNREKFAEKSARQI